MTRLILAALAAVAAFAPVASAHTTIAAPEGSAIPYQRWVDETKVPTPDVTLIVREEACPGLPPGEIASACTIKGTQTIWFEWWMPRWARRGSFLHEVAHNVDYLMPDWVRSRYTALVGLDLGWREEGAGRWTPHEMFAESWAACAQQPVLHSGESLRNGTEPMGGWRTHNSVCRMLARLG